MQQPGFLVLAYTHYPGWRATIDGHPSEMLRANYAFVALPLQPGEHQVMLHYQPLSLTVGTLISGLSLLVVFGTLLARAIQNSTIRGK
jgi:uncharacterized membrane protein YfhO